MPRPASSIIARAGQIAKVGNITATGAFVGYAAQALDELNVVLEDLCDNMDFAAATAQFNFTMNPALVTSGGGNIVTASPNPLPLDYLRVQTSGGVTGAQRSSKWYLDGVAYDMVEIDLTEWDDQVMQAGTQSYPYFWAKDMSQSAIILNVQGDLNPASTTVLNVSSTVGMHTGMSIAGGIGPLSTIVPGTTVTAIGSGQITLSHLPNAIPHSITLVGASLMLGHPPVGLPYPPPSGAFNAMIRYQRVMPPLTQAQVNAGAYCWFTDDDYLIEALAGRLMRYSGDERAVEYIGDGINSRGRAGRRLDEYARLADDRANRGQAVQLDRRSFGQRYSVLRNTKRVGWLVLFSFGLAGMMGLPLC